MTDEKKIQTELSYRIRKRMKYSNRDHRYELQGYEWIAELSLGSVSVYYADLSTLRHMGLTDIAFEVEMKEANEA